MNGRTDDPGRLENLPYGSVGLLTCPELDRRILVGEWHLQRGVNEYAGFHHWDGPARLRDP